MNPLPPPEPGAPACAEDDPLRSFDLGHVASHLLRRAHFRAEAMFMEAFADEGGLTPRQKALLIAACQHPGATQNQLADFLALDRNSLADLVHRLERKGYLGRQRAETDGRAYAVHVTQAGRDLLARVLPRDHQVEEAILGVLPAEYRPLFMKCLRIMAGLER